MPKTFLLDIDGTITDDIPNDDSDRMVTCLPFPGAVEAVNRLHADGHLIVFFTARPTKLFQITTEWLNRHGFKYHYVLCNKPSGGNWVWIDNLDGEFRKFTGDYAAVMPELSH
jgi:hydroxymethylpyrimidine pyrophosphatase-like HAD family hydrolase